MCRDQWPKPITNSGNLRILKTPSINASSSYFNFSNSKYILIFINRQRETILALPLKPTATVVFTLLVVQIIIGKKNECHSWIGQCFHIANNTDIHYPQNRTAQVLASSIKLQRVKAEGVKETRPIGLHCRSFIPTTWRKQLKISKESIHCRCLGISAFHAAVCFLYFRVCRKVEEYADCLQCFGSFEKSQLWRLASIAEW